MRRIALVGLFCLVTLAACRGSNPAASQAYQTFIKQLRAAGATVVETQEHDPDDFSGEDHHLTVNDGWVEVWAYATAEDASSDAARLSPDGGTFRRDNSITIYDWAASAYFAPHYYQKDRLIVLYVGGDSQLRTLLTHLLGAQFAGRAFEPLTRQQEASSRVRNDDFAFAQKRNAQE
jgi:hypothetical protein